MNITLIGADLAKQVFQIYGVDRAKKMLVYKQLRLADARFFSKLEGA